MANKKGKIMSKKDFVKDAFYVKEHYEGLLISSDLEQGCYNIGIQIDENQILVVDQAKDTNIRERIQVWAPQIRQIQKEHRTRQDLQNYVH
ncbi:MAG: hypothetical protein PHT79_09880 [Syntrophomonadaceae bacterium]|nr:hypothetical protein [Syntrophomonadaceae bacterium]MDD4550051.1 hypothetical protein [Syntrophomonadaceae bacterium]